MQLVFADVVTPGEALRHFANLALPPLVMGYVGGLGAAILLREALGADTSHEAAGPLVVFAAWATFAGAFFAVRLGSRGDVAGGSAALVVLGVGLAAASVAAVRPRRGRIRRRVRS